MHLRSVKSGKDGILTGNTRLSPVLSPIVNPILRFDNTVKHDPAIDLWLAGRPAEFRAIAQEWFSRIRQCGSDVREVMHDGCPAACVGDGSFAYVNVYKDHVNVGFFNGSALKDPAGLLEGTGKYGRHVKLKPGREIDSDALGNLVEAAYAEVKRRLTHEETTRPGSGGEPPR